MSEATTTITNDNADERFYTCSDGIRCVVRSGGRVGIGFAEITGDEVGGFGERIRDWARKTARSRAWQSIRRAGDVALDALPYGGAIRRGVQAGREVTRAARGESPPRLGATAPSSDSRSSSSASRNPSHRPSHGRARSASASQAMQLHMVRRLLSVRMSPRAKLSAIEAVLR